MAWFSSSRFEVDLSIVLSALVYCGIASSARAAPVNDLFANRTVLSGSNNLILASNIAATGEPGEPRHAGEDLPRRSVWWSWTAPNTGTFSISTGGSTFDTLLAVYLGSSLTNLKEIVSNDDFGAESISIVFFRAIAGETYQIAVDGFLGASGTISLSLSPSGYPQTPWTLRTLDGSLVSSALFRNRVVMMSFFAITCGDCVYEAPDLRQLRDQYLPEGFDIVSISKDVVPMDQVAPAAAAMGIEYSRLVVNDPEVEATYGGAPTLPTNVLVDREGKVLMKIVGSVGTNTLSYYQTLLRPLLRGAASLPLRIRPLPDKIVLSWPATEFGYVVESAPYFASNAWTVVPTPTLEGNIENTVTLLTPGNVSFYRLRKP